MSGWSGSIPSRWSDAHALFQGPPHPHCCSTPLSLQGARGRSGLGHTPCKWAYSHEQGQGQTGWAWFPGAWRSPRMRSDSPMMAAPEEPLRRRKTRDADPGPGSPPEPGRDPAGLPAHLRAGTFWLTRIVLLRALAFVYCESAGAGLPLVSPLRVRPQTPPLGRPSGWYTAEPPAVLHSLLRPPCPWFRGLGEVKAK